MKNYLSLIICTAEERKIGGGNFIQSDGIWIKRNWFAYFQLGIWNLRYLRKRAGNGRFSVCKEGNKVHITLKCAETNRRREKVLYDKWLCIKEETAHQVTTTFKNNKTLNKLGKYLYKFKFKWENKW